MEVDEAMLEEPGRRGEVEEIDLTEWDKHEDDGPRWGRLMRRQKREKR